MSDFTHELSKIEEQHADDLQNLVEAFRRKSVEIRGDRCLQCIPLNDGSEFEFKFFSCT